MALFGGSKKYDEFLRALPIFANFDDKEITELGGLVKERKLEKRESLFSAGETGDACYIVYSGSIIVQIAERSGRVREVASINEGDILGQVALLDGGPRSATCVGASSGAVVLELKRSKFNAAFDKNSSVAFKLLDVLSRVLVRQFRNANERLAAFAKREQQSADPRGVDDPDVESLFADITGKMSAIGRDDDFM